MLKVLKVFYDHYQYWFTELADPRTGSFFLMSSPIPIIVLTVLYLKLATQWGPQFMKNRKAFNIDKLLIAYNILQILVSANLFYRSLKYTYIFGGYNFICQPVDTSLSENAITIASGVHDYFLVKILDLLDTLFFILRKKWTHISFLHLFHHAGMVNIVWFAVKFVPGGQSVFIGFVNTFVHMIMYGYYLMALLRSNQETIWWKKHVTQLQIIQFLLIALIFLAFIIHPYCGYPKFVGYILFGENAFMLLMFCDFYYKAYIKKASKRVNT